MNVKPLEIGQRWHTAPRRDAAAAPTNYDRKLEQFSQDLVRISSLDNAEADTARATGEINVPRTGSLKQTADGFTLEVLRGTPGAPYFPTGKTTYNVDTKSEKIAVQELDYPKIGPSYQSSIGGLGTLTLDIDAQAVTDSKHSAVPTGTPYQSYGGPSRF